MAAGFLGAVFFVLPQVAHAEDANFDTASEFQARLAQMLAGAGGSNSLTYTGAQAGMTLGSAITTPGNSTTLLLDLGQSLTIAGTEADVTFGSGTTVNLGENGEPTLMIGSGSAHGSLTIDGATVNVNKAGDNAAMVVGFEADSGELSIINGGILNLGSVDGALYSQFFAGYGGQGDITMDDGRVNFGPGGASIRLGIGGSTTLDMRNGSVIDSSLGGSHLWLGEFGTGTATVNLDNSSIIIRGTGEDRYVFVGSGGTGIVNQDGDDSLVHFSGLALIGIGQGLAGHGTYNLNGGRLEVGTDTRKDAFRVGVDFEARANESTALFNVNGGTAALKGNLEIATAGNGSKWSTGTVNLNGGVIEVGGKVVFGKGTATLNLNAGVLELGGSNAITGTGSINYAGGTLRASSDLSVSHAATLNAGGAIFDTNGHTMTYSGALSGTGNLVKTGAGTLVLSGANSYGGGTSINGGTLETKHANALGAGGVSFNGGILKLSTVADLSGGFTVGVLGGTIDLADNNITLSGNISGSGGLTFTSGTLTLGATTGWTGGAVVGDGATLQTSADNQLNSASLLDVRANGTFANGAWTQTFAGLTGSGTVSNDGMLNIGGTDTSSTFDGALDGAGNLVKTGTGTLTLTGTGNATGDVFVSGGQLVMNGSLTGAAFFVDAGATLGGTGEIGSLAADPLSLGGIVAPGNSIGTLEVTGNVDLNGLTYAAEIDSSGDADLISAQGSVSLVGGTLDIQAAAGVYSPAMTYRIISAAGGVDGQFDVVTDNLAFFDASLDYTDHEVLLSMVRNSMSLIDAAETPNQIATAVAVDRMGIGNPIYDAMLLEDVDGVADAFDALSGEVHATVKSSLVDDAGHARASALARLTGERETESSVWARSYGELSHALGDGNAAPQQGAAAGMFAGIDGSVEGVTLGALAGYGRSVFELGERASSATTDTLHLGIYGGTQLDALQMRAGVGVAHGAIETVRSVDLPGVSEELSASYGALLLHGFAEVGYTIHAGDVTFEPFANLAHAQVRTDGFTEAGGDAALAGAAAGFETTLATVGVRASGDFRISERDVSAHASMAWRQALGTAAPVSTHGFAGEDAFSVEGLGVASGALLLDIGIDIALTDAASLNLSYSGEIAAGSTRHAGRLGVGVQF
jgi:fibronectin-binding autotransporter adhesin